MTNMVCAAPAERPRPRRKQIARNERIEVYRNKSFKKSEFFDPFRNGLNYLNDLNVLNPEKYDKEVM